MSDSCARPRVVVVGSINMDLVLKCAQFPQPGETIAADSFNEVPGGKGANQAVSAARAGALVKMIGRVGDDAFAGRLVAGLQQCGVDCTSVWSTEKCESGLALILVEESGQNTIVTVAGANARLLPADIKAVRNVIQESDVVLLQLEVPLETVRQVIEIAAETGTRVILDPAPIPQGLPNELLQVDLICPNEREAEQLTGLSITTLAEIEEAAKGLYQRGPKHVVITLGSQGAYLFDENGGRLIPPFPTDAVDTTAAGDAFAGALAVWWAEGASVEEAVRMGNAAGAIAASRLGAQPSIGSRAELEQLGKPQS
ncbi:ribokinase [Bremerella cremea]|uniref:Ribokinase n=1 Tax=Bremerella cremea TaxID=1031537 RepID=A0A368KVU1_9BACT|nr:ribokinase [Bremerella cremea]RCS54538.1 ribokinase [Bremerella cremea]